MFSLRKIFSTVVGVGVGCALILGSTTLAGAAFNLTPAVSGDVSSINTTSISTEQKLGISDDFGSLSSEQLQVTATRDVPDKTVDEADRLALSAQEYAKQLAKSKAIDAQGYLKTLDDSVGWKTCIASSYGINDGCMGSGCADGSRVTTTSMGVAHRTLPLGTKIQIMFGGKIVNATVVDRGPYIYDRELDLQPAIAWAIGFNGLNTIEYRILK